VAVGDPACEYIVAWEMFDAEARRTLRQHCDVDEATWRRARGWTLSTAVMALPYYEQSNQFMFEQAVAKLNTLIATG